MTAIPSFTWRRAMAIWIAGIALSVLPVASFVLRIRNVSGTGGPDAQLFQHFTITDIDWVFVPFNRRCSADNRLAAWRGEIFGC